jgi:hypothetical protein
MHSKRAVDLLLVAYRDHGVTMTALAAELGLSCRASAD